MRERRRCRRSAAASSRGPPIDSAILTSRRVPKLVSIDDYPAGLGARDCRCSARAVALHRRARESAGVDRANFAATRKLFGVGAEALRAVRDPFRLAAALAKAGLATPRCALPSSTCRAMVRGSANRWPRPADTACDVGTCADSRRFGDIAYLQQRIDGVSGRRDLCGVTERRAELLGVTRQLIGLDWCGLTESAAHRFRYCGSIGPLRLAPALESRFEQLGNALADAFDLQGLFGVDAILANDEIWPVEVNPRYTASVEILERALGIRSIALHVAACGGDGPPSPPSVQPEDERRACCGKAILFAAQRYNRRAGISRLVHRAKIAVAIGPQSRIFRRREQSSAPASRSSPCLPMEPNEACRRWPN